jgi:hypothetical protein
MMNELVRVVLREDVVLKVEVVSRVVGKRDRV